MGKYINKRVGTDVESYLVTEIDEVNGTAMAVEVEKRIKPKMIPGGFAANCPNLEQEFSEAEPVVKDGAKPFQIKRNKEGIWGFKHEVVALALPVAGCKADWVESKRNAPDALVEGNYIYLFEMTKGGKRKTTFEKLGILSNTCCYFYDYNF